MDPRYWQPVIDALRESRFTEISPDEWKQFAAMVRSSIPKKRETKVDHPAVLKDRIGTRGRNWFKYHHDKSVSPIRYNRSSPFAELIQYQIERTEGLSLEKCCQIADCYAAFRRDGMKHLQAKIKAAELLDLKLGHKTIGAILTAINNSGFDVTD